LVTEAELGMKSVISNKITKLSFYAVFCNAIHLSLFSLKNVTFCNDLRCNGVTTIPSGSRCRGPDPDPGVKCVANYTLLRSIYSIWIWIILMDFTIKQKIQLFLLIFLGFNNVLFKSVTYNALKAISLYVYCHFEPFSCLFL
jgi:hypothetical protein